MPLLVQSPTSLAALGGTPRIVDPRSGTDVVVMAGRSSPGRATIVGAGTQTDWDVRKGPGLSGAAVYYSGENLKPFDVIVDLWEDDDWELWDDFAVALQPPRPGFNPRPLGIYHPLLAARPLCITEVVILGVSVFEQTDDGLWTCRITCLPYKKPFPVVQKPAPPIPATQKPQPTVKDLGDIETKRLLDAIDAKKVDVANLKETPFDPLGLFSRLFK